MLQPKGDAACGDVLIVAHGHILRAFAMRWVGRELTEGVSLLLEGKSRSLTFSTNMRKRQGTKDNAAGGVGTLRYLNLLSHTKKYLR